MKNKHTVSLVATFALGWFAGPGRQDPPPAQTPASAVPPAATAPTAPTAAPTAADDPATARPRHPTEGVYALRRRFVGALADSAPVTGYLAITGRHLFLSVAAPGPDPGKPLLRTAVRSWKADRELTKLTILKGWLTDAEGKVIVERPGHEEMRRIELIQGGIRIKQDERNWLEFERLE